MSRIAWSPVTGPSTMETTAHRVKMSIAMRWSVALAHALDVADVEDRRAHLGRPVARQNWKGSSVLAGDPKDPAGRRNVLGPGVFQHEEAALVDDLC